LTHEVFDLRIIIPENTVNAFFEGVKKLRFQFSLPINWIPYVQIGPG